jgi:CHAT domain-containing protein
MWGSLSTAFLVAGSEAVLASLWSIEDQSAREFITRFYGEGAPNQPATALARAQRAFIAAGQPASRWAPFVLFGFDEDGVRDDRTSQPRGGGE